MANKDGTYTIRVTKKTYDMLQNHKEKTGIPFIFTAEKAVREHIERLERKNDGSYQS